MNKTTGKRFEGILCAMLTPANNDGSFNESAMRLSVRHCISTGISGLFVFGTTGEFVAFTPEEKSKIIDVVIDENDGRLPIVAGCGAATTKAALELVEIFNAKKIDYLSCITPYFIAPSQDDLYEYYETVAQASRLPVLAYHIPARTGIHLDPETVERLSRIPNIIGIKDSSADIDTFKAFMQYDSDDFQVILGSDPLLIEALDLGCTAAISAPANPLGRIMVGVYENYKAGNIEEAKRLHEKFLRFKQIMALSPPLTVIKEAANILGLNAGIPQKPMNPPTAEVREKLERLLHSEFEDCFLEK